MKNIYVKDIKALDKKAVIYGDENLTLNKFVKDTREIKKGDVYIGFKGVNVDGNLLYEDAFKKGASVAILEKDSFSSAPIIPKDKTVVLVESSKQALIELATLKREKNIDIPLIAVTGSVGKTSTRDIIESVLKRKYKVLKNEKNYNNDIGVPLTLLSLKDEDIIVLEMGMNHLNEIDLLSKIAKPDYSVITNIGTAHIGNLGSRENILKAKLEVINHQQKDAILFINNDNDMLNKYSDEIKKKTKLVTVGTTKSDITAKNVHISDNYLEFVINDFTFKIKVLSTPFVINSLFAYALAKEFDISDELIYDGLLNFTLTNSRLETLTNKKGVVIINDTYNSSLDSLSNAAEILKNTDAKRKFFVIGDILEVDNFEETVHRSIANLLDNSFNIILYGKSINYTKEELDKRKINSLVFDKEDELVKYLDATLKKGDVILLKASNGMKLINVVNKLM